MDREHLLDPHQGDYNPIQLQVLQAQEIKITTKQIGYPLIEVIARIKPDRDLLKIRFQLDPHRIRFGTPLVIGLFGHSASVFQISANGGETELNDRSLYRRGLSRQVILDSYTIRDGKMIEGRFEVEVPIN